MQQTPPPPFPHPPQQLPDFAMAAAGAVGMPTPQQEAGSLRDDTRRRSRQSMDDSTDSVDENVRLLREGLERMNRQMTNIGNEVTTVKVSVEGVRSQVSGLND